MKRTPLRRVSKEKSRDMRKYLKAKKELSQCFAFCEFPEAMCLNKPTDIHHMKGRHGSLLNDKRYWMLLCRYHHQWIHDNMKEARKLGLILWK